MMMNYFNVDFLTIHRYCGAKSVHRIALKVKNAMMRRSKLFWGTNLREKKKCTCFLVRNQDAQAVKLASCWPNLLLQLVSRIWLGVLVLGPYVAWDSTYELVCESWALIF